MAQMDASKIQMQTSLMLKEEKALKCMEFATEYILKKAEYRILNPLYPFEFDIRSLNRRSQLMAQLNAYSFIKQLSTQIKSTKLSNFSNKKQEPSKNSSDQKKERQQQYTKNQKHDAIKVQILQDVVIQQVQSDEFDNESSKGSVSSKKKKTKFQKVSKVKKEQFFPFQQFDFRKKKTTEPEIRQLKDSPIFNKADSSASNDSFEQYHFGNSNLNTQKLENEQKQILNTSDLNSYHSFTLEDKKIEIDVVSEHPSQNQISYISHTGILNINSQATQTQNLKINLQASQTGNLNINSQASQSENSKISFKKENLVKPPKFQESFHKIHQIQQKPNSHLQINSFDDQINVNSEKSGNQERFKEQTEQEQKNQLLKLQSFDFQQQILMKKLMKVWSRESACLRKIKSITLESLQLPKSTFKIEPLQYANIIE